MRSQALVFLCLVLSPALGFRLIAQPTTSLDTPATIIWVRNSSDPSPLSDLRFVITVDGQDIPLTKPNVEFNLNAGHSVDTGVKTLGKEQFLFPQVGSFAVKAIYGSEDQVLATSNLVQVSAKTGEATPASIASAGSSAAPSPVSAKASNKGSLIAGAVIGALILLLITITIVRLLLTRRRIQREEARLSFRSDQMVQRDGTLVAHPSSLSDAGEGGAVAAGGSNPFEGGVDFNRDVEAGHAHPIQNPFLDPPTESSIPTRQNTLAQTASENPFEGTSVPKRAPTEAPFPDSPLLPGQAFSAPKPPVLPPVFPTPTIATSDPIRPRSSRPRPQPLMVAISNSQIAQFRARELPEIPQSAPVHKSDFDLEMPSSPLTPTRSKPERLMDRRLEQVQSQLDVVRRRTRRAGAVDGKIALKLAGELEKKEEWLKREAVKAWSSNVEDSDDDAESVRSAPYTHTFEQK